MAYIHDPATLKALDDLAHGDGEALAALFESGNLKNLHHFLADRPRQREQIAACLRGKSVRGLGRPTERATRQRNDYLLARVCYWRARGLPGWQVGAELTAFHRAADDLESAPVKGASVLTPEAIYRHVWRGRQPSPMLLILMADAFGEGMRDSSPSRAEVLGRLKLARALGLADSAMAEAHLMFWAAPLLVDE